MRIAGHTLGTPDQTVAEALALFHQAGIDAAEVIYQDGYRSGLPLGDRAAAEEALLASRATGVDVVGLTSYATGYNSTDPEGRAAAIAELSGCIDTAELLGAGVIRVYAGSWRPDWPEHGRRWTLLVEALLGLADRAAGAGVTLCVENHFNTMTQTAAATARLVTQVGHPAVRILYDQANLTFTHGEAYQEALALQAGLIGHVHVKDLVFTDPDRAFTAGETTRVRPEERAVRSRVVGDGVVPWAEILPALAATGYDGVLSLEYEYRWHPQDLPDPSIGFAASAAALHRVTDQLTRPTEDAR